MDANDNQIPLSSDVPVVNIECGDGPLYPHNPPALGSGGDGSSYPLGGPRNPPTTKRKARKALGAGSLYPYTGPHIPPSCLRVAADPAQAKDVPFAWRDESGVLVHRVFRTMSDGIAMVPRGATLMIEATANGYDPKDKPRLQEECDAADIRLRTIPSRLTRGMASALGYSEKSDVNDVYVIYLIGFESSVQPAAFRSHQASAEWVQFREHVTEVLVAERRTKWTGELSGRANTLVNRAGKKKSSRNTQYAIAAMICAGVGMNAKEYDRLIGLNANGFPNMIRAVTTYHGLGRLKSNKRGKAYERDKAHAKLREFRHDSRTIFHFAKEEVNGRSTQA